MEIRSSIQANRYRSAARGKSSAAFKRRCIPTELCCSSVEYVQYAPSSRLVSRAPHRSRCYAGFYHGLPALRHNVNDGSSFFPDEESDPCQN